MFRKISILIALQFTAFVATLLLVNGAIFLFSDYRFSSAILDSRLQRESQHIVMEINGRGFDAGNLSPREQAQTRIIDDGGHIVYTGALFTGVPFLMPEDGGIMELSIQGDEFHVATMPIERGDQTLGYVQVAERADVLQGALPGRTFNLLFITAFVSLLTFLVGLFFAKSSLKPAEQAMRRLEQFTQDASHELRTPLTVLGSSLDLALKTKKYKEGLESAKDDLKRITALVERLLELARLDKSAMVVRTFDLSVLATATVAALLPLATKKKIVIEEKIDKDIAVEGDETLVRQVVENILGNALKFTPEEGTVTVTLSAHQLSIADTGIGIDEKELSSVFQRFYRGDASRSTEGFGLGLALSKRICDLHGWKIGVKSKKGKGTVFTVEFEAAKHE